MPIRSPVLPHRRCESPPGSPPPAQDPSSEEVVDRIVLGLHTKKNMLAVSLLQSKIPPLRGVIKGPPHRDLGRPGAVRRQGG